MPKEAPNTAEQNSLHLLHSDFLEGSLDVGFEYQTRSPDRWIANPNHCLLPIVKFTHYFKIKKQVASINCVYCESAILPVLAIVLLIRVTRLKQ